MESLACHYGHYCVYDPKVHHPWGVCFFLSFFFKQDVRHKQCFTSGFSHLCTVQLVLVTMPPEIRSFQWSDQPHQRTQCMHRRHKNMDDRHQLKPNDGEIALLFLFSSSLQPSTVSLPDSSTIGSHSIPISDSARNLGFILDSKLSIKKHIIKIC